MWSAKTSIQVVESILTFLLFVFAAVVRVNLPLVPPTRVDDERVHGADDIRKGRERKKYVVREEGATCRKG